MIRIAYYRRNYVYVDVDGTVALYQGSQEATEQRGVGNPQAIDLLRQLRKDAPDAVFVLWSGGGEDHAKRMAKILGISDLFDFYHTKPSLIIDDQGDGFLNGHECSYTPDEFAKNYESIKKNLKGETKMETGSIAFYRKASVNGVLMRKETNKDGEFFTLRTQSGREYTDKSDQFECEALKNLKITLSSLKVQESLKLIAEDKSVDPLDISENTELSNQIKRYMQLMGEIEKLDAKLKPMKEEVEQLMEGRKDKEGVLLVWGIGKQLEDLKTNLVKVDNVIFEFSAKINKARPKYKEAFTAALSKVNDATKKILNQVLEATKGADSVTYKLKEVMREEKPAVGKPEEELDELSADAFLGEAKPYGYAKKFFRGSKRTAAYTYRESVYKASEGGLGAKTAVDALKGMEGVKAYKENSPYVGQESYVIETDTAERMKAALRELANYGYVKSVNEAWSWVRKSSRKVSAAYKSGDRVLVSSGKYEVVDKTTTDEWVRTNTIFEVEDNMSGVIEEVFDDFGTANVKLDEDGTIIDVGLEDIAAVKTAGTEDIGSGKLPNKYYVVASEDFLAASADDPHMFSAASETEGIKDAVKDPFGGETFGPFDTFPQALEKFNEIYDGIGEEPATGGINSVVIEDHISGEIYSGSLMASQTRFGWKFFKDYNDDTSFTSKTLGYDIRTEKPTDVEATIKKAGIAGQWECPACENWNFDPDYKSKKEVVCQSCGHKEPSSSGLIKPGSKKVAAIEDFKAGQEVITEDGQKGKVWEIEDDNIVVDLADGKYKRYKPEELSIQVELFEDMRSNTAARRLRAAQLSREDWEKVNEAASDVAFEYKNITGIDGWKVIDLEGQLHVDIVAKTFPAIEEYVAKNHAEVREDPHMWEEFLYKLDEELMERYADEAMKRAKKKTGATGGLGSTAESWMTLLSDVPAGGGWAIDILYDKNRRKIKEIKTHETEPPVFTAEYSLDELLEDSSSLAGMILDQLEKVDPDAYQTITADIHEEDLREDLTPKDEPTKEEAIRYLMDKIKYDRKPTDWCDVSISIDYSWYRKYLDKLDVVDGSNWWRPFISHPMPAHVFLVHKPGVGLFLVDNEGFDYARCVVRVNGHPKYASKRTATGEADQDYDHELFDAICEQLRAQGFNCKHREFDKYQGVYIDVTGIDTFWVKDYFSTGKISKEDAAKPYSKAELVGYNIETGDTRLSPYRGDYFQLPDDKVFEGYKLILVDNKTREVTEIDDPKVSDLPDITDVMSTFTYEKGSETEHIILYPEDNPQEEIEVTRTGDTVDASMLVDYCSDIRKKNFRAEGSYTITSSEVVAKRWETLPKGWTEKSAKKFWESIGGDINKGIEKLKGSGITDPGAFMASLKDLVEGKGWRHEKRKPKKKKGSSEDRGYDIWFRNNKDKMEKEYEDYKKAGGKSSFQDYCKRRFNEGE